MYSARCFYEHNSNTLKVKMRKNCLQNNRTLQYHYATLQPKVCVYCYFGSFIRSYVTLSHLVSISEYAQPFRSSEMTRARIQAVRLATNIYFYDPTIYFFYVMLQYECYGVNVSCISLLILNQKMHIP
jgi:hypothetical protein